MASESRFRITTSGSRPRAVTIVSLDNVSDSKVEQLALMNWVQASFFSASVFGTIPATTASTPTTGWLRDFAGFPCDLIEEIGRTDLLVMVATAGCEAQAASAIGEVCHLTGVTTMGFVKANEDPSGQHEDRTLGSLRPYCDILVISTDPDYIADMLEALRA
jgi:hypothetical protein